jgi:peptidoglycan/xylan/chitin deacetylase (PgdA/CDA1 family)
LRVALTFDAEHPDRPHRPGGAEAILDVLRDRNVPATFFLQGRWVEAFEPTARRIADDGHLVGNHSHNHARLPLLTDDGLATDVKTAEEIICAATGVDPRPWFRVPFSAGFDDPRILDALQRLGYRDIGQDLVLDDWEPFRTGEAITSDVLTLVPDLGDEVVVLFHTWPTGTLEALPAIVDGLRAVGASFVRIDALARYAGLVDAGVAGG